MNSLHDVSRNVVIKIKQSMCAVCRAYLDFDCKFNFDVHEIATHTHTKPDNRAALGQTRICPNKNSTRERLYGIMDVL